MINGNTVTAVLVIASKKKNVGFHSDNCKVILFLLDRKVDANELCIFVLKGVALTLTQGHRGARKFNFCSNYLTKFSPV